MTAPKNKKVKSVTVPDTVKIGGAVLRVTAIGDNAFKGMTKLEKVTVGKNVKKIGKAAFYGDKKLAKITLKGTALKSVGKKAVKKIATRAVIVAPKKKVSAYKKLFTKTTGYVSTMSCLYDGQKTWKVVFKNGKKVVDTQTVANGKAAAPPKLTKKGYVLS